VISLWHVQYHPLGEGHGQAGMVLRSVQGKKHGPQPLSQPQGQLQKLAPRPLRERDERQLYQPQTQQAISIDSDSRPLRTAYPAPRHHPFGESHAKRVPNGQAGDTASRYAPRAQAETPNPPSRSGLMTPATAQQAEQQAHAPAEMVVRYPGLIHAPAKKAG